MAIVRDVLSQASVLGELQSIGWEIAEEFATLVEAVDEKSAVLDSFAGYPKADILAASELVVTHRGKPVDTLPEEVRETLLAFALEFIQTRDRLDVLGKDRIARLMEGQERARRIIADRTDFVTFDQDRFSPGRTVAENILNAKRRFDRKSAWRALDEKMEAAIRTAGLRDELIRLGLAASVGSGGSNLSATARRRVALARALLKRPRLIVLDGVASSSAEADVTLRAKIRELLPRTAFVYAAAADDAADCVDGVVRIDGNGAVRYDPVAPRSSGRAPDEIAKEGRAG